MATAQKRALSTMVAYRDRWSNAGTGHLTDDRLLLQAARSALVAHRLRGPGVLILNDPVGSGKTVVALAAARLLLDQWPNVAQRVSRVVIVAPNAELAAEWVRRSRDAGLYPRSSHGPKSHGLVDNRIDVVTAAELAKPHALHLPKDHSRVLLIIDEAHRGLQNANTTTYQALKPRTTGARVLLVTATPFQMRPSGLELMIEIDGDSSAGDRIRSYGQAVGRWLQACHEIDFPPVGSESDSLQRRRDDTAEQVVAAWQEARDDLDRVFMPEYPRAAMGMPEDFVMPSKPQPVPVAEEWLVGYHAARLLPELLSELVDGASAASVRNSDSYMRMLNSSAGAWRASHATKAAVRLAKDHTDPAVRKALSTLLRHLQDEVGRTPLDHPKVRESAELALRQATGAKLRHVLIFCEFLESQKDLQSAIRQLLHDRELDSGSGAVRVLAPTSRQKAQAIHKASFGWPVHVTNPPVILVVSDKLSESVDLDGGNPVVIHHDLAWSPVRWTQRMGRVVRARTGFQPLHPSDIVVPIMPTAVEQRLWTTVANRHTLMKQAVGADPGALLDLRRAQSDFEPGAT